MSKLKLSIDQSHSIPTNFIHTSDFGHSSKKIPRYVLGWNGRYLKRRKGKRIDTYLVTRFCRNFKLAIGRCTFEQPIGTYVKLRVVWHGWTFNIYDMTSEVCIELYLNCIKERWVSNSVSCSVVTEEMTLFCM